MGKIGIQGIFAGSMTAASLAISAQSRNYAAMLQLIFADEFYRDNMPTDDVVQRTTDFCMFKVKSLSNNERILEQPEKELELRSLRTDPIRQGEATSTDEDTIQLGQFKVPADYFDLQMERPNIPEEFNRKVFLLIEMA
jgi:hypothetical protein